MNVHTLRANRRANEAVDLPLLSGSGEEAAMIAAASQKIAELLDVLRIDHRNDHNTRDTPARVAKMYVQDCADGSRRRPRSPISKTPNITIS
jgi:GTP cyclohydrolase IA